VTTFCTAMSLYSVGGVFANRTCLLSVCGSLGFWLYSLLLDGRFGHFLLSTTAGIGMILAGGLGCVNMLNANSMG